MPRRVAAAVLFAVCAGATVAADAPPAGSWRLTLSGERQPILLLVSFSQAEGKWVGDFIDATAQFQKDPKLADVAVSGDTLRFALRVGDQTLVTFDGVVAKDGKKISGSLGPPGGPLATTELLPSKLKKLTDGYEITREILSQTEDAERALDAAGAVLGQAAAKKMPADEARGIVDRVARLAAGYGPRWERHVALKLAGTLADQAGFAEVALAQARRAERMLTDADEAGTRLEVLETLAKVLAKANKADEARPYQTQIARLVARDYQEYQKANPPFPVEPIKGRKGKTDRVVLVEFFSSADLAPAAAFELARDAILKAYQPKDVIALTYHFHQPTSNDPLANLEGQRRLEAYAESIERGGLAFVAGKVGPRAQANMPAAASKAVFDILKERINEELEKPAGVKLSLTATPEGKGFTAKATVADLDNPGEKTALRFAVAEERVRYPAGNGIRYHHMVVRDMPGGAKGFPLKAKTAEQTVTVNPDELREKLAKYLDEFARNNGEFPRAERPVELRNLKLVAFVQNDATGEVLTAVQVDLDGKK